MRGITFDEKHTFFDWGLMLKSAPKVSPPEPKTHYVDIKGADGMLDLSTMLSGKVKYKNRRIEMEFVKVADREEWSVTYHDILEEIHGKVKKITLDEEREGYYTGRITVGTPERTGKLVTLKMTAEVEPYMKTAEGRMML